jgi:hypothetical protein
MTHTPIKAALPGREELSGQDVERIVRAMQQILLDKVDRTKINAKAEALIQGITLEEVESTQGLIFELCVDDLRGDNKTLMTLAQMPKGEDRVVFGYVSSPVFPVRGDDFVTTRASTVGIAVVVVVAIQENRDRAVAYFAGLQARGLRLSEESYKNPEHFLESVRYATLHRYQESALREQSVVARNKALQLKGAILGDSRVWKVTTGRHNPDEPYILAGSPIDTVSLAHYFLTGAGERPFFVEAFTESGENP